LSLRPGRRAAFGRRLFAVAAAAAAASCAAREAAPKPPVEAAAQPAPPSWRRFAPYCQLQGCCAGHGEVAYLQPDKIIMCTDGRPSEICDCHGG